MHSNHPRIMSTAMLTECVSGESRPRPRPPVPPANEVNCTLSRSFSNPSTRESTGLTYESQAIDTEDKDMFGSVKRNENSAVMPGIAIGHHSNLNSFHHELSASVSLIEHHKCKTAQTAPIDRAIRCQDAPIVPPASHHLSPMLQIDEVHLPTKGPCSKIWTIPPVSGFYDNCLTMTEHYIRNRDNGSRNTEMLGPNNSIMERWLNTAGALFNQRTFVARLRRPESSEAVLDAECSRTV